VVNIVKNKFGGGDIIEVKLMYRSSETYFKGKADVTNKAQMQLLGESLKEKGVLFFDLDAKNNHKD